MQETMRLEKYFPASEVTVLAVCFVMVILLVVSFKVRMKSFRMFAAMLWMLIVATCSDLMLHYLMNKDPTLPTWIFYSLRSIYHVLLFSLLHHYALYTCEATALSRVKRRPYIAAATALFAVFSVADTVGIFTGRTMHIIDGVISFEGSHIFTAGYICFVVLLTALLYRVRRRLYKQVMLGFAGVMVLSISMLAVARLRTQSSYTAATFLFPLIAVMYLLHSNPYDAMLGANDLRGLNNLIRYSDEKQREYLYLSLYMKELDESGSTMSDELKTLIRHVAEAYYRRSALFQVSNGHMLLMVPKDRNRNWQERTEKILQEFKVEYEKFRYDYKLVIGESTPELNRKNEYVSFIRSIHARIPENTIYQVQRDDLDKFRNYEVILKEIADIAAKKDPEDPRVLVYCQPVYNIRTGKYDTAEALMRLQLEDLGLVFPDQFIPLALRDQDFCGDIDEIIGRSSVDAGRIAIELTESRNDSDFMLMKEKIEELKGKGITFYLDDFGTGYSNMERILELPFDIIKFDRSMVIAGSQDKRSEQVLGSLADLFSKLDYSVLYEGVEDEKDEEMCRGLSASYLQGYKYSKPIPISELRKFLEKE